MVKYIGIYKMSDFRYERLISVVGRMKMLMRVEPGRKLERKDIIDILKYEKLMTHTQNINHIRMLLKEDDDVITLIKQKRAFYYIGGV